MRVLISALLKKSQILFFSSKMNATHLCKHTRTHSLSLSLSHIFQLLCMYTYSLTHGLPFSLFLTSSFSHVNTYSLHHKYTNTLSHTHTHTHAHPRTHTHTHTHALPSPFCDACFRSQSAEKIPELDLSSAQFNTCQDSARHQKYILEI